MRTANLYKMRHLKIFSVGILLCSIFLACGTQTKIYKKDDLKIPQTFSFDSDTSFVKAPKTKTFFKDSLLLRLIDSVLINNPDLIIATQKIKFTKANLSEARGTLLPTLMPNARYRETKYGDYTMDGVGNFDTQFSPNITGNRVLPTPLVGDHFIGAESSWEIDIWGRIRNMKNAEKNRFLASEYGRKLLQTQVIAEVAELYYELVALKNELKIVQKNIALQQRAVDLINFQKQGGAVNELAVKQFNAQLLNTKALEYVKLQEIIELENAIRQLSGDFTLDIKADTIFSNLTINQPLNVGMLQKTLFNRPDVLMEEKNLKASGFDVKSARAMYFPTLSLNGYAGVSSFRPELLFNTPASLAYSFTGELIAPLFNQNKIKANHRRMLVLNKVNFQNYRKSILNAYFEITNLYFRRENISNVLRLKTDEVKELQEAVKISNDLFNVGYASYLEVVTAQKMVLESELQLIRVQKEINSAQIQIYRAIGGGTE